MSHCRRDDNCGCDRDYWFRTERDCHPNYRGCHFRPVLPSVLQGTLIIPQTAIPIQIILSAGGVAPVAVNPLQTAVPQILAGGTGLPLGTNISIPGF